MLLRNHKLHKSNPHDYPELIEVSPTWRLKLMHTAGVLSVVWKVGYKNLLGKDCSVRQ